MPHMPTDSKIDQILKVLETHNDQFTDVKKILERHDKEFVELKATNTRFTPPSPRIFGFLVKSRRSSSVVSTRSSVKLPESL